MPTPSIPSSGAVARHVQHRVGKVLSDTLRRTRTRHRQTWLADALALIPNLDVRGIAHIDPLDVRYRRDRTTPSAASPHTQT